MAIPLILSKILLGSTLKNMGRLEESTRLLEGLISDADFRGKDGIKAFALECLGDGYAMSGRLDESVRNFQSALQILNRREGPAARAFLKLALGGACAIQGRPIQALDAFREARADCDQLGLVTWSSYARLLGAEALLALGLDEEAESEILKTLADHRIPRPRARGARRDHAIA